MKNEGGGRGGRTFLLERNQKPIWMKKKKKRKAKKIEKSRLFGIKSFLSTLEHLRSFENVSLMEDPCLI